MFQEIIISSIVVIFYLVSMVGSYYQTKHEHSTRWQNQSPGGMDLFMMICPVFNTINALPILFRFLPKLNWKWKFSYNKFFGLEKKETITITNQTNDVSITLPLDQLPFDGQTRDGAINFFRRRRVNRRRIDEQNDRINTRMGLTNWTELLNEKKSEEKQLTTPWKYDK